MVVLFLLSMYIYANIYMLLEDGLRMGNMRNQEMVFLPCPFGFGVYILVNEEKINQLIKKIVRLIVMLLISYRIRLLVMLRSV